MQSRMGLGLASIVPSPLKTCWSSFVLGPSSVSHRITGRPRFRYIMQGNTARPAARSYLVPYSVLAMVFLHFALVASLVVLSSLGSARAASFAERLTGLSLPARDVLKRATPAAPRFVVYSDEYVSARPTAANIDVSQPVVERAPVDMRT